MLNIRKCVFAGEGGQGIQSIAQILAEAAVLEGQEALYIPNFGVEQRGGISMAYLQIAPAGVAIGAPKFMAADILVALSTRAIARTEQHASQQTIYVYDSSLIEPTQLNHQLVGIQYFESTPPCPSGRTRENWPAGAVGDNSSCLFYQKREGKELGIPRHVRLVKALPAADMAKDEFQPRVANMIILGAVLAVGELLPLTAVEQVLERKFGALFAKHPALRQLNQNALRRGYYFFAEQQEDKPHG